MLVFLIRNYSGILNSDGSPKEGPVDLEINFFDSESGGSPRHDLPIFRTTLTKGNFNLENNFRFRYSYSSDSSKTLI